MTRVAPTRSRISAAGSALLWLLGIAAFINYIDRSNLSIAASTIKGELGLSASQLGILFSAFFWTYALFQPVVGWLVDHFDVNWVLATGFILWSVATASTGLVRHFAAFLVVRFVLGIGESVAYPAYVKIMASNFAEDQRGRANGAIAAGQTVGPAFGTLFGAFLIQRFGWRPFFIGLGLLSLLWVPLWLRWRPENRPITTDTRDAPTLLQFAGLRAAWGTCLGLFCANYILYIFVTWIPFYLQNERHFSLKKTGMVSGGSFLAAAITATVCGRLTDVWIGRGGTPTRVRKTFAAGGLVGAAVLLIACVLAPPNLSIALLIGATMSWAACAPSIWAITVTVAGPAAAGRWTGLQNCVGNFAGIVAPAVTGFILDRTGRFFWPFAIVAGVCLAGAACYVFVLGAVEQVNWGARKSADAAPAAGLSGG